MTKSRNYDWSHTYVKRFLILTQKLKLYNAGINYETKSRKYDFKKNQL